MHIVHAYQICISDKHIGYAYRTCMSDMHVQNGRRMRMCDVHIPHAYPIFIFDMQILCEDPLCNPNTHMRFACPIWKYGNIHEATSPWAYGELYGRCRGNGFPATLAHAMQSLIERTNLFSKSSCGHQSYTRDGPSPTQHIRQQIHLTKSNSSYI